MVDDLIERLLAGPVDTDLSARELAHLEAFLASPGNRPPLAELATGGGRFEKLAQIRDFNRRFRPLRRLAAAVRPPAHRKPITVDEANRIARRLAKKSPAFLNGGARQWADAIQDESGKTCSVSTVTATSLWKATMQRTGRGRGKGPTPKPVALTPKLEAVTGEGGPDEILSRLVGDEEGRARLVVEKSALPPDEAAAVLAKLRSGEMTPSQAAGLAKMYPTGKRTAK